MTRLRATPGVEITEVRLGKPCSATALAKANELLDGGLGKTLTALYGEVDGFSIRWTGGGQAGEIGVLPLARMIGKGSPTAFEDQIWNDTFEDLQEGSAKAAARALDQIKRHRLLWSDGQGRGTFTSLAFARGKPTVYHGGTNELVPLAVTVEQYLDALIACGGLDVASCFLGKARERKAAAADLARAMNDALPGWELPAFLPKAPKSSVATSAKRARVSKGAGKPISRDKYPAIDEPPFIFLEQVYKSEDAAPEHVAFSPDGRSVVSLGHGHFHVIDLGTREIRWRIPLGARSFAVAPDGETIAVAESRSARLQLGERLILHRLEDGEKVSKKAWSTQDVQGLDLMAYRSDGAELAIAAGVVHLLDPGALTVRRTLAISAMLSKLVFVPGTMDRLVLLESVYSSGPAIRVHDLAKRTVVFEIEGASSAAVSADGAMLAVGVSAGRWEGDKFVPETSPRCAIVDARTGNRVQDIPATITQGGNMRTAVAFSPDGARLAYAESAHGTMATIRIFDVATWKQVGVIDVGGDAYSGSPITVFDLAISRDHLLAAATHSNGLRVWRL